LFSLLTLLSVISIFIIFAIPFNPLIFCHYSFIFDISLTFHHHLCALAGIDIPGFDGNQNRDNHNDREMERERDGIETGSQIGTGMGTIIIGCVENASLIST
jgi:hypothetical protein